MLFVYGLVTSQRSGAKFVPMNRADDILHLGLGVGMLALGLLLGRERRVEEPRMAGAT